MAERLRGPVSVPSPSVPSPVCPLSLAARGLPPYSPLAVALVGPPSSVSPKAIGVLRSEVKDAPGFLATVRVSCYDVTMTSASLEEKPGPEAGHLLPDAPCSLSISAFQACGADVARGAAAPQRAGVSFRATWAPPSHTRLCGLELRLLSTMCSGLGAAGGHHCVPWLP